tara:strand:- start:2391 stop:2936 length:546 start_codon:yes stop_codon:yes gene_type:complete
MNTLKKNIILLVLSSFLFSSAITDKTEERINELIPHITSMEWSMYQIPKKTIKDIQNTVKQKFFRKELNFWEISTNDSLKYYAFLDNVIGKTMPITFLVIFDNKATVYNASIIKYREPYGGEVRGKKWLNQFNAYTDTSKYKVGKDISGISGATLSVKSVTKGIHKLTYLIHEVIENNDKK